MCTNLSNSQIVVVNVNSMDMVYEAVSLLNATLDNPILLLLSIESGDVKIKN